VTDKREQFRRVATTALVAQAWTDLSGSGIMPVAPSPARILATCRWAEQAGRGDGAVTSGHGALLATALGVVPGTALAADGSLRVRAFSTDGPWSVRGEDGRALLIGLGLGFSRSDESMVLIEVGPNAIAEGLLASSLLLAKDRSVPMLVMVDHSIGAHTCSDPTAAPLASSLLVAAEFASAGDEAAAPELVARLAEVVREQRCPAVLELVGTFGAFGTTAAISALQGARRRLGIGEEREIMETVSGEVRKAALARIGGG
jgi:hypothetical protein